MIVNVMVGPQEEHLIRRPSNQVWMFVMANSTPGPWKAEEVEGGFVIRRQIGQLPSVIIAKVDYIEPTGRANARLIAAAPDMLAIIKGASHALRSYQYGNGAPDLAQSIADDIDALVAKTEGQS